MSLPTTPAQVAKEIVQNRALYHWGGGSPHPENTARYCQDCLRDAITTALESVAQASRREEREQVITIIEEKIKHVALCFEVPKSAESFVVKELREVVTVLRSRHEA